MIDRNEQFNTQLCLVCVVFPVDQLLWEIAVKVSHQPINRNPFNLAVRRKEITGKTGCASQTSL
jgi:hypothetical protein